MAINPTQFPQDIGAAAFNGKGRDMEHAVELRSFLQSLGAAQNVLEEAGGSHPVLRAPVRALRRIASVVGRPLRIAILGESNSGKSSLANLLVGDMTLPAQPVANTRVPTLLQYAPVPFARAVHASGEKRALSARENIPLATIMRVEVGLPSDLLRQIEILDFPSAASPLCPAPLLAAPKHGIDAAIWTTIATQAWRETERAAWLELPQRIRLRGLLAVTHSDLIPASEDFDRLRARLEKTAKPHFHGLYFVAALDGQPPEATGIADLFSHIRQLARQFSADRVGKAVLTTRRLAAQTLERLGPGN